MLRAQGSLHHDKKNSECWALFRLINSTLCRQGRSTRLEQQLEDHHKALSGQLKMNLSVMFATSTEQHQRSWEHNGLCWVTGIKQSKKWTFPCLLTLKAQLVFSESRRINHASKGKTIMKTYGVTPKNHHMPVINIQQIINHSAVHHLLMTFLSGQTQTHFLSLFLCKSNFLRNHLRHCDGQHLQNDLLVVGIPITVKAPSNLWSRGSGAFGWCSQQRLSIHSAHWSSSFALLNVLLLSTHCSLQTFFSPDSFLLIHLLCYLLILFFSPSQPSLIQQIYIKHLPLQNTASHYLSL